MGKLEQPWSPGEQHEFITRHGGKEKGKEKGGREGGSKERRKRGRERERETGWYNPDCSKGESGGPLQPTPLSPSLNLFRFTFSL